jgi:predicted secreted hydrolase
MKKMAIAFFSILLAVSCAANPFPLRPFTAAAHGTPVEEWAPHEKVIEWWYATGALTDQAGGQYFYQFTVFHGYKLNLIEGYVLQLALTDIKTGRHLFFEDSSQPGERIFGRENMIVFKESRIALSVAQNEMTAMEIRGEGDAFSFAFHLRAKKPAVWHGPGGVIVMGQSAKSTERSFYYSFTDMETEGGLVLGGKTLSVKGASWFDRQWGRFTENAWDWFSLRLTDGRELMLFSFPKQGSASGTLVAKDGTASSLKDFTVQKLNSVVYSAPDETYSLGWRILLASGEEFRVLPLAADQFNYSENTPSYWEGLCSVLSMKGETLGLCVVETTAGAQN